MSEKKEMTADRMRIRPMTRRTQWFAMTMFFVFGAVLAAFVFGNPFGLSFLPNGGERETKTTSSASESKQLYQCPMHPEVIEEEPGDCPICLMDLTPMQSSGEIAKQLYQCPMHPEVIEEEPGDCPICLMDLTPMGQPATVAPASDREVLYWYAPMNPTYTRDEPGKSPMGMDLVPKYAEEATGSGAEIHIDPVQVQNSGVVSERARLGTIQRTVSTVGYLDFNAEDVTWINTKFSGWIEKAHVTYVGQEVAKGDPLFEIYSPELVTTQEEYLRALDYRESVGSSERVDARRQADSLLRSSRERMGYWDITPDQIAELESSREVRRRLTVFAPTDGVVAEVMEQALEGMHVNSGMNLYKIANLSTIWVHADVYETDLPWVKPGQRAEISFRHDPQRTATGKVLFLYPEVNRETRTLKACIEVPNPLDALRAGMYADVVIRGPRLDDAVLIPDSAVLRSGKRDLVFLDLGEGRFAPREVILGVAAAGSDVQVLEGIAPGDAVVTQAQFMLDSESRVQEAIAKFMQRGTASSESKGHAHD